LALQEGHCAFPAHGNCWVEHLLNPPWHLPTASRCCIQASAAAMAAGKPWGKPATTCKAVQPQGQHTCVATWGDIR